MEHLVHVDQLQGTKRKQDVQLYNSTEGQDTNLVTGSQLQNAKWWYLFSENS